ncbi:MAG: hypothetical protein RBT38_04070 [Bacteroidales bacterium]|jgi:hypothetical protein|nr:hypothetical protein [Bacteroidales bacterium]
MSRKILLPGILLIFFQAVLNAQTIVSPNYSLKSHETLRIIKVEIRPEAVFFHMSIENRIEGGSFCADKNISLIYSDGKKSRLVSSSGIPVCPDTYKFRFPGEKLDFILTFPALREGAKWVDLVEECDDNCFSFYGVSLDAELNERIDAAFGLAENEQVTLALASFISIAQEVEGGNTGTEGLLYINIIRLAAGSGDHKRAEEWYRKLRLSGIPRLSTYIKFLNDQGIRY